jgi:hypothetical protein
VAKARIGPEWVAAMIRVSGDSAISRWNPRQNRRTQDCGGSKYISGMVSHM